MKRLAFENSQPEKGAKNQARKNDEIGRGKA